MRDILLIFAVAATFAAVYIALAKFVAYITNGRITVYDNIESPHGTVHIAARRGGMYKNIRSAIKYFSQSNPHIRVKTFVCGKNRMLKWLKDGRLDIAVIGADEAADIEDGFAVCMVPCRRAIESADSQAVCLVWDKSRRAPARDMLLFAVENHNCTFRCGYCDYR